MVFLHDIGGESKTTIIWKEGLGGNYASVRRSVEKLRDAGLVTMNPVERRSNHILIRLTPLGWRSPSFWPARTFSWCPARWTCPQKNAIRMISRMPTETDKNLLND